MSDNIKHTSFEEELGSGKNISFFTVGVSMRPLLRERETHVSISPLVSAGKNDILLYKRSNGQYVLHRCIKMNENSYFMRGDNTYGLEKISKAQAIGVVSQIYRNGRCFSVKNKTYKMYVLLWNLIYPFRYTLRKTKKAVKRLLMRE